ncbi:MAG: Hpt domain-containing protein, partial [Proteobacteria bacterium]|nr:Hpt domain-containing protein [Pseudomonadota bacterium]
IITEVVERIPEGVTAFKEGQQNRFKPEGLAALADALAEGGEAPTLPATALSEAEAVEESFELEEIIDSSDVDSLELVEENSPELVEEDSPELVEEDSPEFVEEDSPEFTEEVLELDEIELEEVTSETDVEEVEPEEIEDAPSLELEELDIDDDAFELDVVEEVELSETDPESSKLELDEIEMEAVGEPDAVEVHSDPDTFDLDDIEEALEVVLEDQATREVDRETVVEAAAPIVETTADALIEDDDLELEEIFTIEAEEKLEIIDGFVANPGEVSSDLVAAFHTLKGSAAMAEISSIATVAAPLEHLANEYLVQNKPADQHLIDVVQEAASLIRAVLQDIPENRDSVPGSDALLGRLAGTAIEVEPEIGFDFHEIQLLSEANIAADGWQDVESLVSELKIAQEQATNLNQPDLSALITSMLRIYSEAPSKPDDLKLSLMKRAHDHLVFMFDALASSQPLRPDGGIIAELDAIDLNPLEVEAMPEVLVEPEVEAAPVQTPSGEVVIQGITELPADNIDEDILPIFLEEAEELQEEIDQSILGWSESGSPGDNLDNLLRQLHTIKGGARMAGAASLGEYAHNFETFLIGVQSRPVDFHESFFALLNSQQDEITRRIEIYQKLAAGTASPEELESLKTALSLESGNGIPGAAVVAPAEQVVVETPAEEPAKAVASGGGDAVVELPADRVDEDILPIFLEESDDLVEELESSIQAWSESPGSTDMLDVLLRNLHTLKGGARMVGLNSLGEYAHNFETFLIGIQKNPIELDDEFFALLNKRQDEVIRRVEIYKRLSFGAASEEDLESLRSALEPTLETDSGEAPDTTDDESTPVEPKAATRRAAGEASHDKSAASANQEMVRVSADLLEELIGLAGESSITRGRVEQQITDFGEYLQEMEETINRIRDQVRRLEIEAESRETLIRARQGASGDSGFDDLEMDRYTMLQAISRALSEGSSDMMDLKDTLGNRSRDAETLLHQQARISAELQEGLTRTRMVPFARLIPRLRRIVRQISGEVGKSVRFDAYNVEGELDRNVLDRIVAPLEHMLRNAVDHGIENKETRVASGKQEQGRISLRLSREGGYVVLTISDDGGGIDVSAVRRKAIERGLITEGQDVSDHEVMQFIMHAGFSTAQKLTQISGRGVGMDVVGSEIKSLGGSMAIDSTLGVGTEFTIRIPFTVSINRALMVIVKDETYAVPLNTIEGIVRVSPYELEAYYQPDAPMFEYAGQPYRLAYIGKMLDNADDPNLEGQVAPLPVILARSGDHAVALQVDKVIGSREVVVKTLGPQFSDVGGISGATVLGDGSVVIILDCMALVRSYEVSANVAAAPVIEESAPESGNKVRTVMIVDDSVTVRKVTSRLMERQGFKVATAKDGVDAMSQLQDIRPDVVLLDIEMPRMDGFEVLRSVRRDENLKDLPIIMITSRTGEKHKQQAMELGVNQYLGKPFQEANLLATIEEVIESAKAKPEQG